MKITGKTVALFGLAAIIGMSALASPAEAYWRRGGGYWYHGYWRPYSVGYYGPAYYPAPVVVAPAPQPVYYSPAPAYYGPAYGPAPVGVSLGVHIR